MGEKTKIILDGDSGGDEMETAAILEQMKNNAMAAAREMLANSKVKKVIVTLGALGVALVDRRLPTIFKAPFGVNVRDTSGAGDAWLGSFTSTLLQGKSEEEAMVRQSVRGHVHRKRRDAEILPLPHAVRSRRLRRVLEAA